MRKLLDFLVVFCCLVFFLHIAYTDSKLGDEALNPQASYCFEFTWLGPDFDNSTRYNGTCEDYLLEHGAKGIPCNPPIVITYNGTFPDIEYLWKHHQTSVICRSSSGQVCARYAYYYDGAMKNATYMCTKVQVVGEEPVTNGCFKQKIRDFEVEVCACKPRRGIYMPCNIHF